MNDKSTIEIYERLGSIEAKIDDIRSVRDMAYNSDRKAEQALSIAKANLDHIERLERNFKWVFGALSSILMPIALIVLNYIIF